MPPNPRLQGSSNVRLSAVPTTRKRDDVRGSSTLDFPLPSQAFSHAVSVGRSDRRVPLMVRVVDMGAGRIGPIDVRLVG